MVKNWYKRSMPTVAQFKPFMLNLCETVKKIKGVNSVLVWGPFVNHIGEPEFVLKNVDIVAANDFHSGDLLSLSTDTTSLEKNANSVFNLSKEKLEDEGFDPGSVSFTKKFIALKKYNVDHWAISNDDIVLHWGPLPAAKNEWEIIKKEAESYADGITGTSLFALHDKNQKTKNEWSVFYDQFVSQALSGMPFGWYKSDYNAKEILQTGLRLA